MDSLWKRHGDSVIVFNATFRCIVIDPKCYNNYQPVLGRTWILNLDNTINWNWWDKTKFIIDLHPGYFFFLCQLPFVGRIPMWTGFTFSWESELHTKHNVNLQLNTVHAFAFIITLLILKHGSRKHHLGQIYQYRRLFF